MLSTLRNLKFIAATYVGHSILRRLAMTGSVGWNVFPVVGDSSGASEAIFAESHHLHKLSLDYAASFI